MIERAKSVREAFKGDLKLMCCVEDSALTPGLLSEFEKRLADLQQDGSATEGVIFSAANPVEAITTAAREAEADVIIKQADDSTPYYVGLADHPDWRLLRDASASVWFVRKPVSNIERVVAAVGHSSERANAEHRHLDEYCYAVFDAAKQAAAGLGSDLSAIHVVESAPQELPAYDIATQGNIMSYSKSDTGSGRTYDQNAAGNFHGRQLEAFADHLEREGRALDVRAGTTEDVIADYSREAAADLVVMGARPMSRWERMRSMPIAEPVLAEVPCDVLAVTPTKI